MTQKKEAGASGERQTGNRNSKDKGTKNKRTRIYPPERKYTLVSKWQPSNNVLLLDRTKKGTLL